MIILLFILAKSTYLDSLLLKNLNKNYETDSSKNFDNFELIFSYRKDHLVRIEKKEIEKNLDKKIEEITRQELNKKIEEKAAFRGTGLIPDITIPIPVELPFGLTDETKVKIGGFQNLSMGLQRDEFSSESRRTSQGASSPGIKLEQQLKVNAEGIIGGKIHLLLDHDSQRETQDLQTIKIRYEGDEDEVIKYLEGGNQIGGRGATGGLFGLAGKFQFGSFDFEATASREMGNKKEIVLSKGGVVEDTVKIEDKDYEKNKFFLIPLSPGDQIIIDSIFVFYNDNIESNDTLIRNPFKGKTFLYENPDSFSNKIYTFQILKRDSAYSNIFFSNIIEIKIPTSTDFILAVAYKTKNSGWIGKLNKSNPLDTSNKFLLLREYGLNNYKDPTWKFMLKNIYYVGQIDSASLKIVRYDSPYNIEQENGKTFLHILGLDKNSDGVLDRYINYGGVTNFIPYVNGYLFIPKPEPFAYDSLSVKDTIIYRTFSETEISQRDHIYKIITVTRRRPTTINLGMTGIVKNSEEIYFGSERWESGKDYIIDYDSGIMQILNKDYLNDLSRELKIKFNERALFQTKKRTFMNLKGNYNISENSTLTFGVDYRGESTAEQKIRFGEEPKRVFLFNSNLNLEKELPFNFFSFLPWLKELREPKLKILSRFNQSFPDPNTRNYAYLDDMESATLEIFADLNHFNWIYGSLPSYLKDSTNGYIRTFEDYFENNLIWFETNKFLYKDIYPYIPGQQGNRTLSVLEVILKPGNKGDVGFASLNQLISKDGIDITSYGYLEVIVKGKSGIIGIDIGSEIAEDACFRDSKGNLLGIGILNSEDGANGGWKDSKLQAREDVGLDMVPDGAPGDAGNDNYEYGDINKINRTEGNGKLDTEDIDGDGFNPDRDDCFTYIIDLTRDYYQIYNGFKFYKIPLDKFAKKYGNPEIIRIKKIRIFFTGFSKTDTVYIAKISITGNKYISQGVFNNGKPVSDPDKKLTVLTYSNQEDANVYKPPPDAVIEKTQEGESEERTLVLRFENFGQGDYGTASKKLFSPQDYWQYKKISFYLKSYPDTLRNKPHFFIKFVTVDTNNYYEYKVENVPSFWERYEIDIEKFTNLKLKRGKENINKLFSDPAFPGYYVKGHPNFKRIDRFIIGVKNESDKVISGEIWFNELLLSSPDRKGAYSLENTAIMDMGEIGNMNLNYARSSPGFSGMNLQRETFSNEDIGGSIKLNLDKLFNINFLNLPVNYSIKNSKKLPIFKTGSDVRLNENLAEREKNTSFNNGFNFSLSRKITSQETSKNILERIMKYTVNPMNYNLSYQYNNNLSPANLNYNRNFQQSLSYKLNLPFTGLSFLNQKIKPFPQNINMVITHSKVKNKGLSFDPRDSLWVQTNIYKREGGNLDYSFSGISPLNSINIDFGGKIDYDIGLKKLTNKFYGKDIKRSSFYYFKYNPTLPLNLKKFIGNLSFSYNPTFNDEHDPINQKDSINPLRTVNNTSNYTIQGNVNTFEIIYFIVSLGNKEALKDINKLRSIFQPVNVNYSRNLNSRYYELRKSPSFLYEIGKTMNPRVDYVENINNNINDSRNLNLNTGTRIQDISVNLSYGLRNNLSYLPYQRTKTITKGQNFPNITVQIDMLNKRIKFLDPMLSSLSFKTSYNLDVSKDEGTNVTNERKSKNYTPLFSIQGRTRNGVGFTLNYNKNEIINLSNSAGFITESKTFSKGININLDFSISRSISQKLFGFLKVKSEVNANISFTNQNNRTQIRGIEQQNNTSTNLNGALNFRFTDDITGSFGILYNSNKDNIQGITNKRYEINFGVRINF
ncbi:MAG: hypothetical protein ABIM98_06705 [candidate division WOR-3 bacterium]